jgi:SAM-dependent methyltransferase
VPTKAVPPTDHRDELVRIHRAVCPAILAWASVPERARLDLAVASSPLPGVLRRRLRRPRLPGSLTARVGATKIDRVLSYRLLYRVGFTPWDGAPGPKLLDRVLDSESAGAGRRALDVGCGKGRDAIHLAKKGWEVTAVDLEERAIGKARERAAEAGADVHWIVGDVTKLGTLAAPPGYALIYDLGCIQGLPDEAAALAAGGITALAGEDATLLLVAFARGRRMILPRGMDRDHVEALFRPAWRLVGTHDVLQLSDHKVPPPIRKARPTAYHLVKA